jgi:YidC/Oxa1 family membrane protein insertase
MGASMFWQQKMTPTAGDPTQAKMMQFMPLIFLFFFLKAPAGLVVYWLMNNLLGIAQQLLVNRRRHQEEVQAKAASKG